MNAPSLIPTAAAAGVATAVVSPAAHTSPLAATPPAGHGISTPLAAADTSPEQPPAWERGLKIGAIAFVLVCFAAVIGRICEQTKLCASGSYDAVTHAETEMQPVDPVEPRPKEPRPMRIVATKARVSCRSGQAAGMVAPRAPPQSAAKITVQQVRVVQ